LTNPESSNRVLCMGRKKAYSAPEGLIRQKGSTKWYIKTRINGKLIYKSTKTSDIQKAELILAKVKVAVLSLDSRVKEIIGHSIPFPALIKRYLDEVSTKKRSLESDKFRAPHLIGFFNDRRIDTITAQDVYQYQDWRKSQYIKPKKEGSEPTKLISESTVNREVSLLRHAMRKAVRWGYIDRNPCEKIEGFTENKLERYISDDELNRIKEHARSHEESQHLADIVEVLYHTAQRRDRILTLKWTQIDLKERTITFEQTSRTKRVPFVIWINDPLHRLLSRLKGQRAMSKIIGPYVFQKVDGTRYKSINRAWKTACKRAGVSDAHVHDLRHKSITDMVRGGFSLEFVGRVAGHSTPSTTKRYTHLGVNETREPLESLGKISQNS
jgi:integrase